MSTRKWTDEQLIQAIKNNKSYAGVIKELGFKVSGGMHSLIKRHIIRLDLDTSHFTGQGHLKNKTHGWTPKIPLEDVLVLNSTYSRHNLKRRLLNASILDYKCKECGLSEWRDKKLSLHLDHINGNTFDNRLENLRMLCPNCHSQTETYAGKNKKKTSEKLPKLCECGNEIKDYRAKQCSSCYFSRYQCLPNSAM